MKKTSRYLSGTMVMALAVPAPLFAGDHVVQPADVALRLETARGERAANLGKVERLLAEPIAVEAAAVRGLEASRLRAAAAPLSDDELRDLAARADSLETDPVAGVKKTWILAGVVAVVLLLVALTADAGPWSRSS